MARLEELEGAKVALDSVIFIYALEGNPEFGDRVIKIFEAIEAGCTVFLTNDTPLRHRSPGIDIWILADIEG